MRVFPSERRDNNLIGPRALLALLLAILLSACGGASRFVLAQRDFLGVARDPDGLAALRGAEPRLPMLWAESARLAAAQAAEPALALVLEGLRFHPSDPQLLLSRVELLELMDRPEEAQQAARHALSQLPPQSVRMALLHALLRNQIALGQLDQAADSASRLAGLIGSPAGAQADAWARLALALSGQGRLDQADACMQRSLARGPVGLGTLASLATSHPETRAASRSLRQRAARQDPTQPDLALTLAVDLLEAGKLPEAQQALQRLPQPMPERLVPDKVALAAHLAILQGRVDEGLALLSERLDSHPGEGPALAVLREVWSRLGRPDDAQLIRRLRAAYPLVSRRDRQEIKSLLTSIAQRQAQTVGPPAPTLP